MHTCSKWTTLMTLFKNRRTEMQEEIADSGLAKRILSRTPVWHYPGPTNVQLTACQREGSKSEKEVETIQKKKKSLLATVSGKNSTILTSEKAKITFQEPKKIQRGIYKIVAKIKNSIPEQTTNWRIKISQTPITYLNAPAKSKITIHLLVK